MLFIKIIKYIQLKRVKLLNNYCIKKEIMVYYRSKAKKKLSIIYFLNREFMAGGNELKRYKKSPS